MSRIHLNVKDIEDQHRREGNLSFGTRSRVEVDVPHLGRRVITTVRFRLHISLAQNDYPDDPTLEAIAVKRLDSFLYDLTTGCEHVYVQDDAYVERSASGWATVYARIGVCTWDSMQERCRHGSVRPAVGGWVECVGCGARMTDAQWEAVGAP